MNPSTPPAAADPLAGSADSFLHFVELQRRYDAIANRLDELEAGANRTLETTLGATAGEYAALRVDLEALERQLSTLAAAHPEWREGQSIRTPLGKVEFRRASRLLPANPTASLLLIESLVGPHSQVDQLRGWRPEQFIVVEKSLKLEALEALDDPTLRMLGIERIRSETISVKPARIDLSRTHRATVGAGTPTATPATTSTPGPGRSARTPERLPAIA